MMKMLAAMMMKLMNAVMVNAISGDGSLFPVMRVCFCLVRFEDVLLGSAFGSLMQGVRSNFVGRLVNGLRLMHDNHTPVQ